MNARTVARRGPTRRMNALPASLMLNPGLIGLIAAVLAVGGCAERAARPAAPVIAGGGSVDQLAGAVAADAERSDHEPDAKVREQLAADALSHADACIAQAPGAAPCLYERAVALGLDARAHPLRALDQLKGMLDLLGKAEAADPSYDQGGPARVRALVLIRAPGWPLGPGDPDAGLESARRAAALRPQYVPNVLALAEAQGKTGDAAGARNSYTMARDLAQALPQGQDRDDWLRQASAGLQQK
jgi:hypothetical protein